MTDDTLELIDVLLAAVQQRGETVRCIRLGEDRKADFEARAGVPHDVAAGTYFGMPLTFDAIDPAAVIVESEPLVD